ncbi:MAG TPA: SDR family oxidoreductase [Acidimicrobiales bacterium]|nr:SDR family oxidoreductase [Acidimicrobiales bacterium]
MEREVAVVLGVGGMGQAIARRLGPSRHVVLADVAPALLDTVTTTLTGEGHLVTAVVIDVSDADAVAELAANASALGPVRVIVHTAGLSPVQASAEAILKVDLLGVAYTLEEFAHVVAPGGAGVVIASMAGHLGPAIPAEEESQLARTPAPELAALPALEASRHPDPGLAYAYAKRANHLRVRAASVEWGRRGARVNSISPGIISTSMGQAELEGPTGAFMRDMVGASGTGRLGTPDDIAAAVEFLVSPAASFVTGTDLLVDGGVIGAMTTGEIPIR